MAKTVTVNLVRDLALKFDQYLHQAGTVALQPWQQEIRDYTATAKKLSWFARDKLVNWGRRKGVMQETHAESDPSAREDRLAWLLKYGVTQRRDT
jgi:hypothetical protein